MWNRIGLGLLCLMVAGIGCHNEGNMEKVKLRIGGEVFTVEVARTPQEQALGLMYRDKLGARSGMIFVYKEYVHSGFWMKNTRIPLSIAFLADDGRILDIKNMNPHDERAVVPQQSYRYALEVNKGTFAELGIGEGDYVELPGGL